MARQAPILKEQIQALTSRLKEQNSQLVEKTLEAQQLSNRIELLKADFQEKLQLMTAEKNVVITDLRVRELCFRSHFT